MNYENPSRTKIITGARRYFFANGFRSVTMDDLAKELGMSKKTIYEYFPSKKDLIVAAIRNKFDEVEKDLERATSASPGNIFSILNETLSVVQRDTAELQPVFLRDIQKETPEIFSMVDDWRCGMIRRHYGRLFVDGQKSGIVRRDMPAELITAILLGAIQTIVNSSKIDELNITPKDAISSIVKVILDGALVKDRKNK
jgi:AcrR family transcriptional regulator